MTLAQYLLKTGTTQAAFAAQAGLAASTVSRYLAGEIVPTLGQMRRIAEATGGAVKPNDWLTAGAA